MSLVCDHPSTLVPAFDRKGWREDRLQDARLQQSDDPAAVAQPLLRLPPRPVCPLERSLALFQLVVEVVGAPVHLDLPDQVHFVLQVPVLAEQETALLALVVADPFMSNSDQPVLLKDVRTDTFSHHLIIFCGRHSYAQLSLYLSLSLSLSLSRKHSFP